MGDQICQNKSCLCTENTKFLRHCAKLQFNQQDKNYHKHAEIHRKSSKVYRMKLSPLEQKISIIN